MSFTSMHNEYLDPDRWLWQDEEPENDEEFTTEWDIKSLRGMVAEYDNPLSFYKSVYESSNVTITMYFTDGTMKCNDELPNTLESIQEIRAISVSSIVEGSDVEIEPITPSNAKEFWEAVEEVKKQADFYWNRDHTTTLSIAQNGERVCLAWWRDGDDHPQWDNGGTEQKRLVMEAFDAHWLRNQTMFVNKGLRYTVEEIIDDSTY